MSRRLPVRLSPRPVAALRRRVRRSAAARHLRASAHAAFPTAAIGSAIVVVLTVLTFIAVSRGHFIAWDGVHEIPTEAGAR